MHSYLALGDSYTIGEGLSPKESFPYQLAGILRAQNIDVADPVIIATTGWTTNELWEAIQEHHLTETFSFVTLLIGVNNQYRGGSLDTYAAEFERLLLQAISFAGGNAGRVLVLSIPDWGCTPYAGTRDRAQIAKEIDAFNEVNRRITAAHHCLYTDVTGISRAHCAPGEQLVADELHYSAAHYQLWAAQAAPILNKALTT